MRVLLLAVLALAVGCSVLGYVQATKPRHLSRRRASDTVVPLQ